MSVEQESRRSPRLPIELAARLEGRTPREVRVLDLSRSGCLVRCPGRLDVGAIVDLRLDLAGSAVIAKARVAESSVDGVEPESCLAGLEFLTLPPEDGTRLLRFIEEERRRRCPPGR